MSLTKPRTVAAAAPPVDVGLLIERGDRETGERLAVVAADAAAYLGGRGLVYAAWLTKAATLLPTRPRMCAADVFGAVVDAVMDDTGRSRPEAAQMARTAHDTLVAVVRHRAPWLAKHEDPLGEYVPYLTRSSVVGLLLAAGMRATSKVGGSR